MSIDALLLLQRSDVPVLRAEFDRWRGVPLLCIDPGILSDALAAGLPAGEIDYRPLAVGRRMQSRVAAAAHARSLLLDQSLAEERARVLPDAEVLGWNHVPLYLFFLRTLIAKELGRLCADAFREAKVGVLRPTCPAQFYFDSFVAVDAFCQASPRFGVVGSYGEVMHRIERPHGWVYDIDWIAKQVARGLDAVVHLPTVWRHRDFFVGGIIGEFPRRLDLPSAFWDIPVDGDRCPLQPFDATALTPDIEGFRERVSAVIQAALSDLGPGFSDLRRQADELSDCCRHQLVQHRLLSEALRGCSPAFILTEHDTGMVGPLFSIAHALQAPITVIPHSSYPTQPLPHAQRVVAVERDGFGSVVRTVTGERVASRPVQIGPPPALPAIKPPRVIALMANTLSSQGLSYIDLRGLVRLHRELAAVCQSRGVALRVRLKPGAACLNVASPALGLDPALLQSWIEEPLERFAAKVDLCVAFGELSSGLIDFLEAGAAAVHVSDDDRSTHLISASALSTLPSLPSLDISSAVSWVERQLKDFECWIRTVDAQRSDFAKRRTAQSSRLFGA